MKAMMISIDLSVWAIAEALWLRERILGENNKIPKISPVITTIVDKSLALHTILSLQDVSIIHRVSNKKTLTFLIKYPTHYLTELTVIIRLCQDEMRPTQTIAYRLFRSALPKRTENALHHIKTVSYFARSVPSGI